MIARLTGQHGHEGFIVVTGPDSKNVETVLIQCKFLALWKENINTQRNHKKWFRLCTRIKAVFASPHPGPNKITGRNRSPSGEGKKYGAHEYGGKSERGGGGADAKPAGAGGTSL